MAVARFVVQGDEWAPETGEVVEAPVPVPCSAGQLKASFPFEGTFHFRQQVSSPDPDEEYLWFDLTDDAVELEFASGRLEVRVLPLDLHALDGEPTAFDADRLDWGEEEEKDVGEAATGAAAWVSGLGGTIKENWAKLEAGRKLREASEQVISSEAAAKLSSHGVKIGKGIGKMFRSGASAVQQLVQGEKPEATLPSPAVEDQLQRLTAALTTEFDDGNPTHVAMLRAIWDCALQGQPFARQASAWRTKLGFAHNNPLQDSKGSGILAVRALLYFVERRPDACLAMINSQQPATKQTYPVGVVAINLTLMLVSVVGIKEHRYRSKTAVYWDLFQTDGEAAFCEIFVAAFFFLDHKWTSTRATRADFPKIMVAVKIWVETLLESAPNSVQQLQDAAGRLGGSGS